MSATSESDSDDEGIFAPPTPTLPEVDGVEELFRTYRPPTHTGFENFAGSLLLPKNEYEYDDLEPNKIRILQLNHGEGDQDIECSLITIKLSSHGKSRHRYQALSYVWGVDDPRSYIRIWDAKPKKKPTIPMGRPNRLRDIAIRAADGGPKKFYVRANLCAALKQFRKKDENIWLWVDAICINQKNAQEKNQQLSKMHDIYNNAYNVCIWLGEADEEGKSDRAMEFIHKAVNLRLLDGLVSSTDLDTLADRATDWDCLADLMSASWFSRRWVVQEVALARRASLHCGAKTVNWLNFADAVANFSTKLDEVKMLYRKVNSSNYNPESLTFVEALGAKAMVATINNLFRRSDEGDILERLVTLETLVSTLLTFDAGNPRDIIYALLSIARDSPLVKVPPRSTNFATRDSLRPNYAKDALEVYTDFVHHCIESGSLDIICRHWAVPVRKETKALSNSAQQALPFIELPSWIGLLKDSSFGPPDKLTGRVNGDSLVGAPNQRRYNASDGEAPNASFDIKRIPIPRPQGPPQDSALQGAGQSAFAGTIEPETTFDVTLRCKGLKLDTITTLSARMVNATIPKECLELGGWTKAANLKIPTRVPENLWRTLVADRGPDGQNPPSWYHRACLHCLATTSPSGDINTGELIRDETSPQLMVEYLKRVQSIVWSRRVLVAASKEDQDEHLFGLAPEKAEVGDFVCILLGCSVPVILRQHDSKVPGEEGESYFEFIGESYIHGKMDGEALSKLTKDELDHQTSDFRLR